MLLIPASYELDNYLPTSLAYKIIADAGRTCYKTNPAKEYLFQENADFVRRIVKIGHHSVLEHASVSVRFRIDRAVSHELVRHRLASYSQESQRYCKYYDNVTFIQPHWYSWVLPSDNKEAIEEANISNLFYQSLQEAERQYKNLLSLGMKPEDARGVLPNATATEIVMTANMREWLHVFFLRCSKAAHPDMSSIMNKVRAQFIELYPAIFGGNIETDT